VGDPLRLEPGAQRRAVVPGVALIEVDREQVEVDRGSSLQRAQQHHHPIAILAARHGDEDAVAIFDEAVLADRAPDVAQKLPLEFHEARMLRSLRGWHYGCRDAHGS